MIFHISLEKEYKSCQKSLHSGMVSLGHRFPVAAVAETLATICTMTTEGITTSSQKQNFRTSISHFSLMISYFTNHSATHDSDVMGVIVWALCVSVCLFVHFTFPAERTDIQTKS